ncbi:MAG TPA: hypothetical protein VLJ42_08485 [Solirubrobacteraceae bacterium]|nr:hypothetical protein [Solirubrobacteraceae bacterium]
MDLATAGFDFAAAGFDLAAAGFDFAAAGLDLAALALAPAGLGRAAGFLAAGFAAARAPPAERDADAGVDGFFGCGILLLLVGCE